MRGAALYCFQTERKGSKANSRPQSTSKVLRSSSQPLMASPWVSLQTTKKLNHLALLPSHSYMYIPVKKTPPTFPTEPKEISPSYPCFQETLSLPKPAPSPDSYTNHQLSHPHQPHQHCLLYHAPFSNRTKLPNQCNLAMWILHAPHPIYDFCVDDVVVNAQTSAFASCWYYISPNTLSCPLLSTSSMMTRGATWTSS